MRSSNVRCQLVGGVACSTRSTPPNGRKTNEIDPIGKSSLPLMSS